MKQTRFDRRAKYIFIVIACGGLPFLFFEGTWSEAFLKLYLMTGFLMFILFYSYWESTKERWFWKAFIPISAGHMFVMLGLLTINLEFPQIDRLPRLTYGALTLVLGVEVLGSLRLLNALRSKESS